MAWLSGISTMKKIIAELVELKNGSLFPRLYCLNEDGSENREVTDTLLEVVSEIGGSAELYFENLLRDMELGKYMCTNSGAADFSLNDKNIWVFPPKVLLGNLCISNENISDFSIDDGEPQFFSVMQYRLVMQHWKAFCVAMSQEEGTNLIGQRFEMDFT